MKLSTQYIKKHFGGVRAVNGISVDFMPGQITGVIGPNGSGKTTLMHLVTGVMPFDSGVVIIGDDTRLEKIDSADIRDLGITRTFQNVRVFEQMTVLDNILVVLTNRGLLDSLITKHQQYHEDKAQEVLELVGLWSKRDHLASSLSYGQRKLLEVARALATDATIYLFDEPFAGLFPEMIQTVSDVMVSLRNTGKTVILIEHNMFLIRKMSDMLYVFDAGELLAFGEPDYVLSLPGVREAYLGE